MPRQRDTIMRADFHRFSSIHRHRDPAQMLTYVEENSRFGRVVDTLPIGTESSGIVRTSAVDPQHPNDCHGLYIAPIRLFRFP